MSSLAKPTPNHSLQRARRPVCLLRGPAYAHDQALPQACPSSGVPLNSSVRPQGDADA